MATKKPKQRITRESMLRTQLTREQERVDELEKALDESHQAELRLEAQVMSLRNSMAIDAKAPPRTLDIEFGIGGIMFVREGKVIQTMGLSQEWPTVAAQLLARQRCEVFEVKISREAEGAFARFLALEKAHLADNGHDIKP